MNFLKSLFLPSARRQTLLANILAGFAIGSFIVFMLIQINQLESGNRRGAQIIAAQENIRQISLQLVSIDGDLERYLLLRSQEYRDIVQLELQTLLKNLQALETSVDERSRLFLPEAEVSQRLQQNIERILTQLNTLSPGQVNELTAWVYDDLETLGTHTQSLNDFLLDELNQIRASRTGAFNRIQTITILAGGLILLLAVGTSFVSDAGLRAIGRLTEAATTLAGGDLTRRVDIQRRDEIGALASAFNSMAAQLEQSFTTLEQRVAERTKALQTLLEVSRRLSAATSPRQLATDVVEQLQAAFGYYHAHIYYLDEQTGDLVMSGGTGEAGAAMLAAGHRLPKGRGLVGRAAETNQPVLVPDTAADPGWLPNPLLPETRSEAAVPIALGNQVLGVLDVQQNIVNGLTEEDVQLLQAIAAQVAISLQNARAYERAQLQAEHESAIAYLSQRIQRAVTPEETLQTVIEDLAAILGARRVAAVLSAPQEKE